MKAEINNKHLVVTGGNGFLGKQICQLASQLHIPVISISRSGKPKNIIEQHYTNVKWIAADIFNQDTWKEYLNNAFALIHCIGIIDEIPEQGITYKKMIFQSAEVVGIIAKKSGVKRFIYISAGAGAPDSPSAYMENKIAAELFLSTLHLSLVVLKPGMLFGNERPYSIEENRAIQKLLLDPYIGPKIKDNRPLAVEVVAKAALYAALNWSINGKLNVDEIEKLSDVKL